VRPLLDSLGKITGITSGPYVHSAYELSFHKAKLFSIVDLISQIKQIIEHELRCQADIDFDGADVAEAGHSKKKKKRRKRKDRR
jgi:hypothetical protein